eukprot:CAMPEP_0114538784 /NCGR_PEP_ID=MMETSP0109-20121206/30336_1 /TAXON_ID=29199 /ORGANISM="Chlorarachnion reptans, Strain CCCM449" /LENGTH=153 /DNA_ID=CAMNT_0001722843 /DNA_START=128 /DNA_END=589 /DNA_ORIENTATION=+
MDVPPKCSREYVTVEGEAGKREMEGKDGAEKALRQCINGLPGHHVAPPAMAQNVNDGISGAHRSTDDDSRLFDMGAMALAFDQPVFGQQELPSLFPDYQIQAQEMLVNSSESDPPISMKTESEDHVLIGCPFNCGQQLMLHKNDSKTYSVNHR